MGEVDTSPEVAAKAVEDQTAIAVDPEKGERLYKAALIRSDKGTTYAAKISKSEARVDWTRPASEVDRQIRGLSPFPGAWVAVGDERLKLLRSRPVEGNGTPGEVLSGMTIACGSGAVEVLVAQREGKRPMAAADLLRGLTLPARLA